MARNNRISVLGMTGVFVMSMAILLSPVTAKAISIGFESISRVVLGTQATFNLVISDLFAGSAPSLGTWDLDIAFDPAILGFNSATFGDQLSLTGPSLTQIVSGTGTVNLFELSFDFPDDLDTLQLDTFVLASLTFDTLALGTSSLGISLNALGDAWGDPLSADLSNGSVSVAAPVPEPATLLLMVSGLLAIRTFNARSRT